MSIETVVITPTEAQAKAVRVLARSLSKKSATELANDLFSQVVRGRFKAKMESATADFGAKWDNAAQFLGADKMPQPKKQYVEQSVQEMFDLLKDL